LFADRAFDRRVVWGSAATVADVGRRGGATDTIVLRPRHAVSLIGCAAVRDGLADTVRRAAVDSLVADQQACMSSLLHVVESDDDDADRLTTTWSRPNSGGEGSSGVIGCWIGGGYPSTDSTRYLLARDPPPVHPRAEVPR
jgi:hypothetical protein